MRFVRFYVIVVLFSCMHVDMQAMSLQGRKTCIRYQSSQKTPNILFFLVDQLRYPVVYESEDLRVWQRENLVTMTFLQDNGVNFDNHYCGSIACVPSRTTLFTGQYPSLHGVSQTDGAAKSAEDPMMFWLRPNNVPTAGNIFTEGRYATYYIGKWHISNEDLHNSGTQVPLLSFNAQTGEPNPHYENIYRNANQLSDYGFSNGWIGPDPHGSIAHQSGASAAVGLPGRDVFYADETVNLLGQLDTQGPSTQPWFMVCSFVNPHDISLYGDITKFYPVFNFETDPTLPSIPAAPTALEDLSTKPTAQQSYKEQYQNAFQPTTDTEDYRQLYYTLQKKVDAQMARVLTALESSQFKNNTIIVFTADHGELLGAHSNFQKWFNMYEESIHVPLIFYSPTLLPQGVHVDMITSHVDVVPTLCGLASVNYGAIINLLKLTYINSVALVGRDLSTVVLGTASTAEIDALREPILFQTFDQIFTGEYSENPIGTEYSYVTQPAFVNAIVLEFNGQTWKLARYFQDESFATPLTCTCSTPVTPASDPTIQYEMYNLSDDPLETENLANPAYSTPETLAILDELIIVLDAQLVQKALEPIDREPFERILPSPS